MIEFFREQLPSRRRSDMTVLPQRLNITVGLTHNRHFMGFGRGAVARPR